MGGPLPGLLAVADVLSALLDQPYLVLGVVQTALLLAATVMLVYPVVAYARNVAYTEGLVALAVGLTLVTVANLVSFVPEATARRAVPLVSLHPVVWSTVINFLAGVAGTTGVYFFAREFLPPNRDRGPDPEPDPDSDPTAPEDSPEPVAGFEGASDDRDGGDGSGR